MNSTPGPETRIGQQIRRKLKEKAEEIDIGFKAIKIHMNEFMEEGTPDLLICIGGQQVMIETKTPDGEISPIQLLRLREWGTAGAVVGVCESVSDAMELTLETFRIAEGARRIRNDEPLYRWDDEQ